MRPEEADRRTARINAATRAAMRELVVGIVDDPAAATTDDRKDLLIALEGVVAGVFVAVVKLGGDDPVLDVFVEGVKERLARARLGDLPAEGSA